MSRSISVCISFIFLFIPSILNAIELDAGATKTIQITSERLEARDEFKKISFSGNVVAKDKDLTILCNLLQIFYTEQEEIEAIKASGEVKIEKNFETAYAEKATYFPATQKIHLVGNARVVRDGSSIEGDSIIINIKDDMSIVESNPGRRIKAIIESKENTDD